MKKKINPFFKKKKIYLKYFTRADLLLLKQIIYRDNYNNKNALKIKLILKPLKKREMVYKELRRLWLFLNKNKCFYSEFQVFKDYVNGETFTSNELTKINDFFLSYKWDNIKYIELKKRLYNGTLNMSDFKKITKILYNKVETYKQYFTLKTILNQCLNDIKHYKKWVKVIEKDKVELSKKKTRRDLIKIEKSFNILNQRDIDDYWELIRDLLDGELYKGKLRVPRYFFHNRYRIHLTVLKSFIDVDINQLLKLKKKTYYDHLINDQIDDDTKFGLLDSDLVIIEESLNYFNYIHNNDYLNIKYFLRNDINYFFSTYFSPFKKNILKLNELKKDLKEKSYVYFVGKHANNYNSLKVGWGRTYDLVNMYGSLMDHKYIIGSKAAFEFISEGIRKDDSIKWSVQVNALSWWLLWEKPYKLNRRTKEYRVDLRYNMKIYKLKLREVNYFLNIKNILDNNIELNLNATKIITLTNLNFKKILNIFYLNFKKIDKYFFIYVFFKKNLSLIRFKYGHYIFLKNCIYLFFIKIIYYLRLLKIKDYFFFLNIKKNNIKNVLLNLINYKGLNSSFGRA